MSGNIFNKQGFGIPVIIRDGEDYLSLTHMAEDCRYKPKDVIRNFFSSKDNLRYIITWQITENPDYLTRIACVDDVGGGKFAAPNSDGSKAVELDCPEFDTILAYVDSITNSIKANKTRISADTLVNDYGISGLYVKKGGRGGQGVYAHHDIALHFATWLNPAYGVFVNKDYQRLKSTELDDMAKRGIKWKFDRRDAATWHRMMKSAVQSVVVPAMINQVSEEMPELDSMSEENAQQTYDTLVAEAMITLSNCINVAVFGMTAQQWREENPGKKGNMRDYATEDELNLVSYLEYQLSQIVAENPLDRNKWSKGALRITKECHKVGINKILSMFRGEQEVTPVEPISYDARTLTARESAAARFKEELLTGEIQYDKKDNVFRNSEGFICLGWKI